MLDFDPQDKWMLICVKNDDSKCVDISVNKFVKQDDSMLWVKRSVGLATGSTDGLGLWLCVSTTAVTHTRLIFCNEKYEKLWKNVLS